MCSASTDPDTIGSRWACVARPCEVVVDFSVAVVVEIVAFFCCGADWTDAWSPCGRGCTCLKTLFALTFIGATCPGRSSLTQALFVDESVTVVVELVALRLRRFVRDVVQ